MTPPLYARILAWFLLNAVVIALLFYGVIRWQFNDGLQSALGGMAEDRLQAIGTELHQSLTTAPIQQWDDVLLELGKPYQAQAALLTVPEAHIAGTRLTLPPEVSRHLLDMHPDIAHRVANNEPPLGRDRPPRRHQPPPRDPIDAFLGTPESLEGFNEFPPRHPEERDRHAKGASRSQDIAPPLPASLSTFMIRAGQPAMYYTGIRLPPPQGWQLRDGPLMLLFVTPGVTGNGLFLDVRPWLFAIFGAMAVSALLWLPFVRGITSSIRQSMRATEQIATGRFDVRVPVRRTDEIGRLATAINQMAANLDGHAKGQKRFLGDIAHELCHPVARLEMNLGILENQLDPAHASRIEGARAEVREMSALVNELLSFSKSAIGQSESPLEYVPLTDALTDAARTECFPEHLLHLQIPSGWRAPTRGTLLRRALGNILRNAILHAPGSPVDVTASLSSDLLQIRLTDHGPGVPPESLPRLFDPFYRVDTSRTRDTGGTGLGLSIVKTSIESIGGTVTATSPATGGLELLITLPAPAKAL
jgi:two-component system sensor histidine kinase CpxA